MRYIAMLAALMLAASGSMLLPEADAAELTVNNVHCVHRVGVNSPTIMESGAPYHDGHDQDLRGNCLGIHDTTSLTRYGVGVAGGRPTADAELYLRALGLDTAIGNPCLQKTSSGAWHCADERTRSETTWKHFPHEVTVWWPHFPQPQNDWVYIGFGTGGSCDSGCQGGAEPSTAFYYSGQSAQAAEIIDPTASFTGNGYISAHNFTTWLIHDPEEDDQINIGGVPLKLDPGTKLTLIGVEIEVHYRTSSAGGNEWSVSSKDDEAFVWNNAQGTWQIWHLDY